MSKNLSSMAPEQVAEYVNYNKYYAIVDSLQGVVQINIFPNDLVALRTFNEMCENLPDSTSHDLKICDLGYVCDLDLTTVLGGDSNEKI